MKLILKYLKPFTLGVIISLIFLFIQSRMDLRLPNYMSDIINVGIQQNGITDATPKAISVNGYRLIRVFMSNEDKETIDNNYQLIKKGNNKYIDQYKGLSDEDLYVLVKDVNIIKLDKIFANSTATMFEFFKSNNASNNSNSGQTMTGGNFDFKIIYQKLPMLEMIPANNLNKAREDASKQSDSLTKQMAIGLTKNFYKEIKIDIDSIQTKYIINKGIVMLAVALIGGFSSIVVSYNASKIAAKLASNMRKDVFTKVMQFTNNEYDQYGASSLITRTTNDITQVQQLIFMGIRIIAYAPMMGIGGVLMALEKSSSMSWIIALAVSAITVVIMGVFKVAMPKFKLMQELIDKLNLVSRENLNGMMVIRAFGTEEFEEKRFNQANKDLAYNNLFIGRVMSTLMPVITFIMSSIILLIVWVGAHNIADSTMQIGDMMAFMQYTMQIIMSFLMITMMFIMVPRAAVSLKRIKEVLDTNTLIKDPEKEESFDESKRGVVEFDKVSFKYKGADQDVLNNISFKAMPGTTTAIIGSTGSGKSTLINLIPRFYDVTSGKILVNGVDVRNISGYKLREVIGYIPQRGILLSGTILSNLIYGKKNATIDEVKKAAEVAQATDFIEELDGKYESRVAQGGTNVSGGQKQRLSIARALVKKPDIYIFDDSFSAVDYKTDVKLRSALKKYTTKGTVIIVAQRISTIMNADNIIVLNEGSIVGMGKHDDLLKNCPTYLEIASSQLSKEEL